MVMLLEGAEEVVLASERRSDRGKPSRITVNTSSMPSRILAPTPSATCSGRHVRSLRSAFPASSSPGPDATPRAHLALPFPVDSIPQVYRLKVCTVDLLISTCL
jgi:hypothetical protein